MTMTGETGSSDKIVFHCLPGPGSRRHHAGDVGPGNYVVQADMPDATGPPAMHVSLVEDVSGDNTVTRHDIQMMKGLKGVSVAHPGILAGGRPMGEAPSRRRPDVRRAERRGRDSEPAAGDYRRLDPTSDPDGNGLVTSPDVTISGQPRRGDGSARPGGHGHFHRGDHGRRPGKLPVPGGGPDRPHTVLRRGHRGRPEAATTTSITGGDVVIAWNQTMLRAIQITKDTLGVSTRTMAMVQEAVYDAVNAIDDIGTSFHASIQVPQGTVASPDAAASEAA